MPWQIGKTKVFLRAGQMAELDARRAEVLGNAARTIQRQIRTHMARKEFIAIRKAAIRLQSYLRGIFLNCHVNSACPIPFAFNRIAFIYCETKACINPFIVKMLNFIS